MSQIEHACPLPCPPDGDAYQLNVEDHSEWSKNMPGILSFKNSAAVAKPTPTEIHRRIAKACLRLEHRSTANKRRKVLALVEEAVVECVANARRQSVRDHYHQLQWTALNAGLAISLVPSESTFRRHVKRAGSKTSKGKNERAAIQVKELEAVLIKAFIEAYEMTSDRTVCLRRNC